MHRKWGTQTCGQLRILCRFFFLKRPSRTSWALICSYDYVEDRLQAEQYSHAPCHMHMSVELEYDSDIKHMMILPSLFTRSNLLPELRAFDDIGDGVLEPMSHVFTFSLTVRPAKNAPGFCHVLPCRILVILLESQNSFFFESWFWAVGQKYI